MNLTHTIYPAVRPVPEPRLTQIWHWRVRSMVDQPLGNLYVWFWGYMPESDT